MGDALPTCCLKVNWRGWWAARGQWERSGAESTLRLYYSVVPLPAADASPAHSRSSASSSGSWIIQFPSKCNISWRCSRRISIRATAWSYRYDLHALPLLSAFFFFLSFFARFFLDCDERRAREFRSEWVWLYVDALLQGTSMVVVLHADIFNTEVLVARRILSEGAQRSCAAAGALRRTPGWKSEQSSLVALGWPYVSCNVPACWKGDSPWSIPEGVPLDKL